jgi:hypothetical protein
LTCKGNLGGAKEGGRSPVEGSSRIDNLINSLVSEMSSTAKAPVKQTQAPQNGKQGSDSNGSSGYEERIHPQA